MTPPTFTPARADHPDAADARAALRWDVFCRVIDNHGDLGVCWRFATSVADRGHHVRLWVDDASALAWMAPRGHTRVLLRPWGEPAADERPGDVPGDVVVEAFGCDPPAGFVARMSARVAAGGPAPVWINLEYLSAEAYVERSHGLASPQFSGPARGLTKWFWFPSFTPLTGGLMRDRPAVGDSGLAPQVVARDALWHEFGLGELPPPDATRVALLFCYDNPALREVLDAMSRAERPWHLLVTPGLSEQAVLRWWRACGTGAPLVRGGAPVHLGALGLQLLHPVEQTAFDRLLRGCDLNFVRGEDSFVRAHWAGRPFIWQAYVQDDGAQHAKIAAWLDVWTHAAPTSLGQGLAAAHAAWNQSPGHFTPTAHDWWQALLARRHWHEGDPWSLWCAWSVLRRAELTAQVDLVTQLTAFVARRRQACAG